MHASGLISVAVCLSNRSPNEIEGTSLGNRASVLRDNPAFRPDSAPHPLILENHLFQPFGLHADTPTHPQTAPHTPTELERELKREASEERERNAEHKDGVAEDLRIKQEPDERERANGLSIGSSRRSDGLYGSAQRSYEGAVAALPCSSSTTTSSSLQHGYVNSSHVELPSTSTTSHHLQHQQQQLSSPPSSVPPALPSSSPTSSSQSPLSPSIPSTSRGPTGKSPPNGRAGAAGPGRSPKFAASRTTPVLSPTDPTSPVSWSSTAKLNKKLTYVTAPDG
ncbi:uncharacterized protein DDB_G0271670-like, partial [Copidosoma floridanum]|uniref:uncharacterized protein DDB_G0271670-like n=1 Tax=Copidosoma floridanum TaxID=29053 RepID=UPI0006C9D329